METDSDRKPLSIGLLRWERWTTYLWMGRRDLWDAEWVINKWLDGTSEEEAEEEEAVDKSDEELEVLNICISY